MTKNNKKSPQSACAAAGRTVDESIDWPTAITLFWPVAILGAAVDLWTKSSVFAWLSSRQEPYFSIIDGFLRLIMRENTGAAFSVFQGWTVFLIIISCVALVVVIGIFFSHKISGKWAMFALGCITAGITGNLYDRLFNDGRVRDFIDVYVGAWHWPTFNVADSLLCIGVGLLIITSLKHPREETSEKNQ
jgi:signal peptidase II